MMVAAGSMIGNAVPLELFARLLSQRLGRPVVDKTGLKGLFDIRLRWTPGLGESPLRPTGDALETSGGTGEDPSIFVAIQEQLGLKLDSVKGPAEFLVIDRVERPTEN